MARKPHNLCQFGRRKEYNMHTANDFELQRLVDQSARSTETITTKPF